MKVVIEVSPEESDKILETFETSILKTEIEDASDVETVIATIFKSFIVNVSGSLAEMSISCLKNIIETSSIYQGLSSKFDLSELWEFDNVESEEEYENKILDE